MEDDYGCIIFLVSKSLFNIMPVSLSDHRDTLCTFLQRGRQSNPLQKEFKQEHEVEFN